MRRRRTPEFMPCTSPASILAWKPHMTRSLPVYQSVGKVVATSPMTTSMSSHSSHSAREGGMEARARCSRATFCQAPGRMAASRVWAIWCSSYPCRRAQSALFFRASSRK